MTNLFEQRNLALQLLERFVITTLHCVERCIVILRTDILRDTLDYIRRSSTNFCAVTHVLGIVASTSPAEQAIAIACVGHCACWPRNFYTACLSKSGKLSSTPRDAFEFEIRENTARHEALPIDANPTLPRSGSQGPVLRSTWLFALAQKN
jgi:hypothetical protein